MKISDIFYRASCWLQPPPERGKPYDIDIPRFFSCNCLTSNWKYGFSYPSKAEREAIKFYRDYFSPDYCNSVESDIWFRVENGHNCQSERFIHLMFAYHMAKDMGL